MPTDTQRHLSKWVSDYMNTHGFDHQRIQERIHLANKCSRARDISTKCITKDEAIEKVYVGSIREGIGMNFCNDTDILQINHSVICVDGNTTTQNDKLQFQLEQKRAPAGYTLLKLMRNDSASATYESLKYAMVEKTTGQYLSSNLYMTKHDDVFQYGDGYISKQTRYRSRNGPSIPKYVEKNWIQKFILSQRNLIDQDMDFVRAFPCQENNILGAWKNRNRKSGWPNQETIDKIMSLPMYVVPVGKEGSINEDLQWRISFTMAETHLIQAFNNTQSKVIVLLKLIAKHILQPLCSGITSYIVKTVMLWQAESIPQEEYSEENLLSRLEDALVFLKSAVGNKSLPSYMIPQKNLLKKLKFLQSNGLKLVDDYLNGSLHSVDSIVDISETFRVSNLIDSWHTRVSRCFTTEELANLYTKMFTYRSFWQILSCNSFTNDIPNFILETEQATNMKLTSTSKEVTMQNSVKTLLTFLWVLSNTDTTKIIYYDFQALLEVEDLSSQVNRGRLAVEPLLLDWVW
ncbi:uncharacterized protein LOC132715569 [Ruditapes philippinarum]|uniref:uncharacterized protein LOC132715569 n=1 Tax=Ruditapes philippinarum TaxID=129788 RepID=UPI00295A7798|nr:uncharacterized protein LOC132715569 [Ruditapes philippinarum]